MDALARFGEYAAAFEQYYESRDSSILEPFFTEDAVYEIFGDEPFAGIHEGRDAVFAHFERSLDGFDRRFASRTLEILDGPSLSDGEVWLHWRGVYKSPGLPELVFDGEETVFFDGDRISRIEDDIPLEMASIVQHWLQHYAEKL